MTEASALGAQRSRPPPHPPADIVEEGEDSPAPGQRKHHTRPGVNGVMCVCVHACMRDRVL